MTLEMRTLLLAYVDAEDGFREAIDTVNDLRRRRSQGESVPTHQMMQLFLQSHENCQRGLEAFGRLQELGLTVAQIDALAEAMRRS